ncbi:choice-of-anchor B family protein [Algibacter mikhailovii]|uniref:choice-of-anchor B family protein n=1 Tax=Algibacter mikhailovii TaxID=425498 RepID=UPI00249578C6|nr:choice-of-anchor B family protein [Algibacter mikhailovii]
MNLLKILKTATLCCFMLILDSCCNDETPANPNAEAACKNGFAGIYPCNNYDLMGFVPIDQLGGAGSSGSDCWGWTDTSTQKEYALFCATTGVAFVDISVPENPIVIGILPTATISSPWRDIKVYQNFAFVVADRSQSHGMQIFDLTRLRDVSDPPETFSADAIYNGFTSAHNIVINEDSGFAYAVGTSRAEPFAGGPLFIDLENPLTPIDSGGYPGYSHDAQVVTYNGPDTEHNGKEILIGSNEIEVIILDVTDKSNPIRLSSLSYANVGYTHQGWFTEDMTYFVLGDELDEQQTGTRTRSIILDLTDLDNPKIQMEYLGPTNAIDHNGYVKENSYFQASYTAGMRELDITNIENKAITEIGYFDTHPENNSTNFNGAWSVYPYFPSGNIIISDIDRGLFIVKKNSN